MKPYGTAARPFSTRLGGRDAIRRRTSNRHGCGRPSPRVVYALRSTTRTGGRIGTLRTALNWLGSLRTFQTARPPAVAEIDHLRGSLAPLGQNRVGFRPASDTRSHFRTSPWRRRWNKGGRGRRRCGALWPVRRRRAGRRGSGSGSWCAPVDFPVSLARTAGGSQRVSRAKAGGPRTSVRRAFCPPSPAARFFDRHPADAWPRRNPVSRQSPAPVDATQSHTASGRGGSSVTACSESVTGGSSSANSSPPMRKAKSEFATCGAAWPRQSATPDRPADGRGDRSLLSVCADPGSQWPATVRIVSRDSVPFEIFVKKPPILQSGQRVGGGIDLQFLQLLVFDHHRDAHNSPSPARPSSPVFSEIFRPRLSAMSPRRSRMRDQNPFACSSVTSICATVRKNWRRNLPGSTRRGLPVFRRADRETNPRPTAVAVKCRLVGAFVVPRQCRTYPGEKPGVPAGYKGYSTGQSNPRNGFMPIESRKSCQLEICEHESVRRRNLAQGKQM